MHRMKNFGRESIGKSSAICHILPQHNFVLYSIIDVYVASFINSIYVVHSLLATCSYVAMFFTLLIKF